MFYVILEKSVRVKPYVRSRKGRLERVRSFERKDRSEFLRRFREAEKVHKWPPSIKEVLNKLGSKDKKLVGKYLSDKSGPTGIVGDALQRVITLSKPIKKDFVSFRGYTVSKEKASRFIEGLKNKITKMTRPVINIKNPSSFTWSQSSAWLFAKRKGYRDIGGNKVPILLKVLVPKGEKVAFMGWTLDVGFEHMLGKNTKVDVVEIKPYNTGWQIVGMVRKKEDELEKEN